MSEFDEFKVVIRCALQSFDDMNVFCSHDWTIRNLKEHLRDVCSENPNPDRQRLIYAGQCLENERALVSILSKNSTSPQVIHLVHPPSDKVRIQRELEMDLRRRKTAVQRQQQETSSNDNANMTTPVDWQQAQMQLYRNYMAHYHVYMQQVYGMTNSSELDSSLLPASTPSQAAPAPVAIVADPPMNAQGGLLPDDDAELREHDWLDWLYTIIRAALLTAVIYFYSSTERLFVVVCFLVFIWIAYGALNNIRRAIRRDSNRNQNQENHTDPSSNGPITPVNESLEPSAWTIFWTTCYTFVISFFVSLIPDHPPPLNIN